MAKYIITFLILVTGILSVFASSESDAISDSSHSKSREGSTGPGV